MTAIETKKHNKWCYLWIVQGHYGQYGWEDLTASESHSEARADLRAYRENVPGLAYRMIQRRELNEAPATRALLEMTALCDRLGCEVRS